jgi:hypothetical protein
VRRADADRAFGVSPIANGGPRASRSRGRGPSTAPCHPRPGPRGVKLVRLLLEFTALAQSHEDIRAEVAAYAERFREAEKKAFARILSEHAADAGAISPAALSVLLDGVSRAIAMERAVGITDGHAEVITLLDDYLRRLDAPDANSQSA